MSVGGLNGGTLSLSKLSVGGIEIIPGQTVGGVSSLQNLTGDITLVSPNGSITFTPAGTNIALEAVAVEAPVQSVEGLTGAITFSSPNSSITITPAGTNIALEAQDPPVLSVEGETGAITFGSPNNSITISTDGSQILLEAQDPPVQSVDGLVGAITFSSPNSSITITPAGTNIALEAIDPPVQSVGGLTGAITFSSPDSSITITPAGTNIALQSAVSTVDLEGLQNKLGIIPALPYSSDTIALASANTGTPPTAIVPDGTPPTASTTPAGTPCWLYTKPPANTGFNWYMYQPRFGAPSAPLPYKKYSANPADERIQSVWALVQPAVNTNIYTAGIIALNLYSFDDANPPTSSFYNTRWAYSNQQGQNSGATGVNLYAGFTYLLYAFDAPRTTNTTGVGVPDEQDWGLRDPYDIYPEINHIPLQNCVIAFNPWTDGTNYQTWTTTGVYTNGQTVVFSGFGLGGTGNGIFYTVVGSPPVNTPPLSATGVPSAFYTAISPQPSSYASQPILSMNFNGINGSTTGWTTGNLLRVVAMGYTTGNTPFIQTSSVRYVLN